MLVKVEAGIGEVAATATLQLTPTAAAVEVDLVFKEQYSS